MAHIDTKLSHFLAQLARKLSHFLAQIDAKFRVMAEPRMGAAKATGALAALRQLDTMKSVAAIPPLFVLD